MLWVPGGKLALLTTAAPDELSGTCPITVPLLKKVTIPVGVPALVGIEVTVAVNVTAWPKLAVPADELNERLVAFAWTFCNMVTEVAGCAASPLKVAVMK